MKKIIKHIYKETIFGKFLEPIKWIYDLYIRLVPDKKFIRRRYKEIFGVYPNLENPETLNEKMQWLKLNDRTLLHTICADKYKSREYITEKVGKEYLVPLVFETKNPKNITSESLPDYPVAVKTNHDSSGAEIIRGKSKVNFKKLQKKLQKLLKINFYYQSKEWQYKDIERRILVEKLLICKDGKVPNDYKIHCFNGEPKIIYTSVDREGKNKRNIYDIDWNPLMFTWAPEGKNITNLRGEEIPKPENYDKMLEIARILSKSFKYVRIDLYNVDGKIYCGEITFYHGSGMDIITPKEWDRKLGDMLDLGIK